MSNLETKWLDLLIQTVPEAKVWIDENDMKLPYVAFGHFASHLRRALQQDGANSSIVISSLRFMDLIVQSNDKKIIDLLCVGAFEGLIGFPLVIQLLRPMMTDKVRNAFDYTLLGWYGSKDFVIDWRNLDLNVAPDSFFLNQAIARVMSVSG